MDIVHRSWIDHGANVHLNRLSRLSGGLVIADFTIPFLVMIQLSNLAWIDFAEELKVLDLVRSLGSQNWPSKKSSLMG